MCVSWPSICRILLKIFAKSPKFQLLLALQALQVVIRQVLFCSQRAGELLVSKLIAKSGSLILLNYSGMISWYAVCCH